MEKQAELSVHLDPQAPRLHPGAWMEAEGPGFIHLPGLSHIFLGANYELFYNYLGGCFCEKVSWIPGGRSHTYEVTGECRLSTDPQHRAAVRLEGEGACVSDHPHCTRPLKLGSGLI